MALTSSNVAPDLTAFEARNLKVFRVLLLLRRNHI
jgi:hypothetical protein